MLQPTAGKPRQWRTISAPYAAARLLPRVLIGRRENPISRTRVSVNARLFDDFDLDAVPVEVIDGKNF
jgi:hypothetical protein